MEQQYLYGQHPYQQPEQDFTSYHPYPILPSPQLSRHHQHQYSHERRSHHHPMGCRSSSRWRIPQEQVQIQIREDAYQLQQPLEVVLEKRKYALRSREEMDHIFHLCCSDKWPVVLNHVQQNPGIALTPITMGNNITTTILHQAITKRAKKVDRVQLIFMILQQTPDAAAIRNGYGSLPLHAIGQRNIGIDSNTKEQLIRQLVHAYPSSVAEPGGVGKRTPLHIIFTGK